MPKKIVSVTLSEKSIKQLDKTSKALGMSRSELVEFLVEKGFDFPEDVKAAISEISELQTETKEKFKKMRR